MKIAFHSNQLSLRGTETALFDYARYNEDLLNNDSIVITSKYSPCHNADAIYRFANRFECHFYEAKDELDKILKSEKIDVLYCIKAGFNDGIHSRRCRTCIHSVFEYVEPHGDVYAYVSEWLAKEIGKDKFPFVPHIVKASGVKENLRKELGIPEKAMVFGRHGGPETFDINFAQEAVLEAARIRKDHFFIFLQTHPFGDTRPNIIFLPATSDESYRARFVNTCNAMLHARNSGETFGLSVAEFSVANKPVLTWSGSHERGHIEILGDKGIYYSDYKELLALLLDFKADESIDWNAFLPRFSPENVMKKFSQVFLS